MKYLFILFSISILFSCQKKERYPYLPTWIDGTIKNVGDVNSFIPNAKIYLMELHYEGGNGTIASNQQLSVWDLIDSTLSDENGDFHMEFEARIDNLYGLYCLSDNHLKWFKKSGHIFKIVFFFSSVIFLIRHHFSRKALKRRGLF